MVSMPAEIFCNDNDANTLLDVLGCKSFHLLAFGSCELGGLKEKI